eukprot:gene5141-5649_t
MKKRGRKSLSESQPTTEIIPNVSQEANLVGKTDSQLSVATSDDIPITVPASAPVPVKGRRGRKPNAQKALEREQQLLREQQAQAEGLQSKSKTSVSKTATTTANGTGTVGSSSHGHAGHGSGIVDIDGDPRYDIHPLKVGHHIVVSYRDGSNRIARVVEVSPSPSPSNASEISAESLTYYLHYLDFNRRMDEWVPASRIVHLPSVANKLAHDHTLTLTTSTSSSSTTQQQQTLSTVADLDHDEHEGLDEVSLLEHEKITKVKNVRTVQLGRYIMECWYFSPFPKEYTPNGFVDCLYFCEFSFRFFRTKQELIRYQSRPDLDRHPPGNEIYRDDQVSMFELDGGVERIYCQNLCFFAKLFLDHKTLYWDVDQFLFYILCSQDERGYHPVGYFSKEKYSDLGYNLACILTFPCYQRKGYGRFLMEFSYELSKKEEKVGSPEKPLSDLGAVGYRSYWASVLLRILKNHSQSLLSIIDLSCMTSILPEDLVSTLTMLGLLKKVENGEGGSQYVVYASPALIDELLLKYPESKLRVDPLKLHWTAFYVTEPKKDKWSLYTLRASASSALKPSASTASFRSMLDNNNNDHQKTSSGGDGAMEVR